MICFSPLALTLVAFLLLGATALPTNLRNALPQVGTSLEKPDFAVELVLAGAIAQLNANAIMSSKPAYSGEADSIMTAGSIKLIPVAFHVIHENDTYKGGNLTEGMINDQIEVMNASYEPCGIRFELTSIDFTQNAEWFANIPPNGTYVPPAMKTSLRVGDAKTLNFYTVGFVAKPAPGPGTFPWLYAGSPENDGVVINYATLPGGTMADFSEGKTAVHETGHWFGLFHTFQGGCQGPGDLVDDTPAQAIESIGGCPIDQNSCPDQPGVDPIHNFMDHSNDACRTEFTPGQVARMIASVQLYRGL